MSLDLLIQNATVLAFKADNQGGNIVEVQTNVGAKDGKITHIGSESPAAAKVIDAKGLHLLPGVIDSQVHMREPGMTHKEDLQTGTLAAALGGVTSVFEMPNTVPVTTTKDLFEDKLRRAQGRASTNFAFFIGASGENAEKLSQLEILPGCSGVKIFMGSSTGSLLVEDDATLERVFRSGHRRVIIHSEDEFRLRERKHIALDSKDVRNHHIWRDVETAVSSTKRLLALSEKTGRKVHVLHVTTAEEMELLKGKKPRVTVEVLPQHLTLAAPECYERLGTLAQQNPPIREVRHQEALWKALREGTVDVIGSDHAPHTLEEKGREYPNSPSGVPGVQTLVPIMLNHVHQGRLSLSHFVRLVCENPRWVFGCKSKGRIELGRDADFTLVDLQKERVIENNWIASRCGWTPFDGMKVRGWPVSTILAGQVIMQDDQVIHPGMGKRVDFDHDDSH